MKDTYNLQHPLQFSLEEQYIMSKTGKPEDCEDSLYIGDHFAAVIDGATSKTSRRWNGETGGKVAARLLSQAFDQIPYNATAYEAVDRLTAVLRDFYEQQGVLEIVKADPLQRTTASVAAISFWRREIWIIGDCQCLLNNERIANDKLIDTISSNVRALFLEAEIIKGATIEELRQVDTGRAFILPLLERQTLFQNNPSAGKYWYPVVDGFPVPNEGVIVKAIPNDIEIIVIATDGYPVLKSSLNESETALREILRYDPLLFRHHKSTKGTRKDHISFDDRAFVRLRAKHT